MRQERTGRNRPLIRRMATASNVRSTVSKRANSKQEADARDIVVAGHIKSPLATRARVVQEAAARRMAGAGNIRSTVAKERIASKRSLLGAWRR